MTKLQHTVNYLKLKDSKSKLHSSGPKKEQHRIEQITKDRLKHSTLNRFKRSGDDEISREPIAIFHQIETNKEEKQELETLLSNLRTSYLSNGNLKIGAAVKNGDCFFDSVAQGLNELKDKGLIQSSERFNAKSLREVCKKFAQSELKKDQSWLKEALKKEAEPIEQYIPRIEFTADDVGSETAKILVLNSPIWGRPEIEGKMLCNHYKLGLQYTEVLDDIIIEGGKFYLGLEENNKLTKGPEISLLDGVIKQHNIKPVEQVGKEQVVHVLNYKQHFVPLLSHLEADITENVRISKKEVYGVEDEKSPTLIEDIRNFDLKENNNPRGNKAELHSSGSRLEQQSSFSDQQLNFLEANFFNLVNHISNTKSR